MGYLPRVCFEGALYHLTMRGDNRERVFLDDDDRHEYLRLLRRYKDRVGFKLHAYVLMSNHVHLILEPASGTTVSRIMQCVTIAYTKLFNHRHHRVGHVFQGRFHSRLIEKDSYLLAASRYVHLNPVRARLVRRPLDYPWSSYRVYRDPAHNPLGLVDTTEVLALMSPDVERQRGAYGEFVEGSTAARHDKTDAWLATAAIAGSATFVASIQTRFGLSRRQRGRPKIGI